MHRRLIPPPNPVVVKVIFRKPARIHHAKMRADARHSIRRRLPAIVEPRPAKSTRKPRVLIVKTPPSLRRTRPARMIHVISTHIPAQRIVLIHAARRNRTRRLSPNRRLRRKLRTKVGDVPRRIDVCPAIVQPHHIHHLRESLPPTAVHSRRHHPRRIQPLRLPLHRRHHRRPARRALLRLPVRHRPDHHARTVPGPPAHRPLPHAP